MIPRAIGVLVICAALTIGANVIAEEDPFAAGVDALAVNASDGSGSLRAKIKVKRISGDMVMVQVKGVDDSDFPHCVVQARVLKPAKAKAAYFKLLGRGKTYRFAPVLKMKGGKVALKDKMTQNNLGACYYPKRSKLILKISGVDLKKKVFNASEVYLK